MAAREVVSRSCPSVVMGDKFVETGSIYSRGENNKEGMLLTLREWAELRGGKAMWWLWGSGSALGSGRPGLTQLGHI